MNLYRSTINLAGCRRGATAEFPDTIRTAVLVSQGVLVPVVPSILERPDQSVGTVAPALVGRPVEAIGDTVTGDGTGEALPPIGTGAASGVG